MILRLIYELFHRSEADVSNGVSRWQRFKWNVEALYSRFTDFLWLPAWLLLPVLLWWSQRLPDDVMLTIWNTPRAGERHQSLRGNIYGWKSQRYGDWCAKVEIPVHNKDTQFATSFVEHCDTNIPVLEALGYDVKQTKYSGVVIYVFVVEHDDDNLAWVLLKTLREAFAIVKVNK